MNLDKNFKFKKKYGQNFLKDQSIINKIVSESKIDKDTLIIEIGPGSGVLTKQMAPLAGQVISFEIDETLQETLNSNLSKNDNVKIVYKDFLKIDIMEEIKEYNYKKIYVVANLPYYITTPIINKIIDSKINIDKIVVMVQKEVGDRFCAKPGCKEYGSITVYLNYYFNTKKIVNVPRKAFIPEPNVDSVVIEMSKTDKKYKVNEEVLFKLIKDAFQFKRKNLNNNLKSYKDISNIFSELNLSLSKRAEELELKDYINIANRLSN